MRLKGFKNVSQCLNIVIIKVSFVKGLEDQRDHRVDYCMKVGKWDVRGKWSGRRRAIEVTLGSRCQAYLGPGIVGKVQR